MFGLYYNKGNFNVDISGWDVSKVTTMYGMFVYAITFDQAISSWDVSKVTNMDAMFYYATAFSQNLSTWCVEKIGPPAPPNFDQGAGVITEPSWGASC